MKRLLPLCVALVFSSCDCGLEPLDAIPEPPAPEPQPEPEPFGAVSGRVCGPDGVTWLAVASVWIEPAGETRLASTSDGDGRETRFPSRRLETPTPRRWRHPISYYRDRAEAQGWVVGPLERGGAAGDQPDRLDLELTKEVDGHVQHIRVGVRRTADRGLLFLDGAIDDVELCPPD